MVVVGSGVAGLTAALGASRAGKRVLLLTKAGLDEGSTCWAQGGIAAALPPGDTPAQHARDTVEAGAGLCDAQAVDALAELGPRTLRHLTQLGAGFDLTEDGSTYAYTREGGHSLARIVHAGGDATGREVQRALRAAVREAAGIDVLEYAFALDLVRGSDGTAAGLTVAHLDQSGEVRSYGTVHARAVALATGGFGQLYATTSNPDVATGDGLALALRAGAEVTDVEFVQFHPTVLFSRASEGRQPLISEALRGEGATLVDATGERVMAGVHPLEDLAPRDVVARSIAARMADAPGGSRDHVYLDARPLGKELLLRRFPTITAACHEAGFDPAVEPIPVAPAAHYACGGVRVDPRGRTSIPGLYAAGEVACTGVHGANRLASNSLLEGLVMGDLLAGELAHTLPVAAAPTPGHYGGGHLVPAGVRDQVAATMARHAGVLRDAEGLDEAAGVLESLAAPSSAAPSRAAWEATNLHAIATVLVSAARAREESRGCHVRTDYPQPRAVWRRHLVSWRGTEGELRQRTTPGPALDTVGLAA